MSDLAVPSGKPSINAESVGISISELAEISAHRVNIDFVCLFVGGSTAAGGQGVDAVLPYEAGMSYFPLTLPGATLRVQGPNYAYFKVGAQRSIDPQGGPTEVSRNNAGFRFIPRGDKLLLINEGGYLREATNHAHEAWLRGGHMYNTTAYTNVATGKANRATTADMF
jgi:porin